MKEKGEDINITDSTCQRSATTAFKHHLSSNKSIPNSTPLFAFETGMDTWSPMRRSWFIDRCNAIWLADGLMSVKGHCFQVGGTTHLLLMGVDPWVVMIQGHLSSQAFLMYWRCCEEVLSLFISFSFQLHDSILSTMKNFKAKLTC